MFTTFLCLSKYEKCESLESTKKLKCYKTLNAYYRIYKLCIEEGNIKFDNKAYDTALAWYKQAYIDQFKELSINLIIERAQTLNETEHFDQAIKYLEYAIENGNEQAKLVLGNVYYNKAREIQDIEEKKKYLINAIDNSYNDALIQLAKIYKKEGSDNYSEKLLLQAIEKNINRAYYELGLIKYTEQEYRDAIKYLEQFEDKGAVVVNKYLMLARSYAKIDNGKVKAIENYKQVIERTHDRKDKSTYEEELDAILTRPDVKPPLKILPKEQTKLLTKKQRRALQSQ